MKQWRGVVGLPIVPPLAALLELAVLVAAIVAIDWAFPSLGFMSAEPSPFWLPVLLLSLQYGTIAGLLAAAAATAAYVVNGVAEQAVGENYFTYLLRIWALPILWIGVALVLGQFRLRQIAAKERLRQSLRQRTDESARLAAYAKDLEGRCHRLERQLTTRNGATVKPTLDALAQMGQPASDVTQALDVLATRIWPGAQVSVFAGSANGCELIGNSGWPDAAPWVTEIQATHPLFRAITEQRRTVSILNRGDEKILAGQGIAAEPILSPDGSRVIALLKIEALDAAQFDQNHAAHLNLIARLLGQAMAPHLADAPGAEPGAPVVAQPSSVAWFRRNWKSVNGVTPAVAHEAQAPSDPAERGTWPPRRSG